MSMSQGALGSGLAEPAHISRYRQVFQQPDRWLSSVAMLGSVVGARRADPIMVYVNATLARFQTLGDRLAALMVRHESLQEMRAGAPVKVADNMIARNQSGRSADIAATLASINALYTVYSDVLGGPRVAGTAGAFPASTPLPETLKALSRPCGAYDDLAHRGSSFGPSPLYGHRCTYHYPADIVDPQTRHPLGALVTVFDIGAEFRATGREYLPEGGEGLDPTPEEYVDPALLVPLSLRDGAQHCWPVCWQGRQPMLSAVASSGYREYKRTDGYRNDPIAVVGLPRVRR